MITDEPRALGSSPLLSHDGQMQLLQELYEACRDAESNLDVKKSEAALRVVRTAIEATTKRDTEKALKRAEKRDRALEELMAAVKGGTGRLEHVPIPPITGVN